jgi:hypothetical protein
LRSEFGDPHQGHALSSPFIRLLARGISVVGEFEKSLA